MARIKCPNILCRSADVSIIGAKTKHALNLNPFHPLTIVTEKPLGTQTFRCNKCGKVFTAKL